MSVIHIDGQPYIVATKCWNCHGEGMIGCGGVDEPPHDAPCDVCSDDLDTPGTGYDIPPEVTEDCAERTRTPLGAFPAFDCPHPTHHHGRRTYVPDPDAEVGWRAFGTNYQHGGYVIRAIPKEEVK